MEPQSAFMNAFRHYQGCYVEGGGESGQDFTIKVVRGWNRVKRVFVQGKERRKGNGKRVRFGGKRNKTWSAWWKVAAIRR